VIVEHWQPLIGSAGACAIALPWLAVSAWRHGRRLAAVPVRVHVGGTRGKTATARLIGAGLRASGRRVVVKTTGTVPLVILPDGTVRDWPRLGPPSIAELTRFMRLAVDCRAEIAVIESMAVEPEYLWTSERYLVRATHVAVTNLRPDHEEALVKSRVSVGAAMAHLVPRGGRLFLTSEADVPELTRTAADRGSEVEVVPVTGHDPQDANAALALAVCRALDVPEATARPALAAAGADPGAFRVVELGNWGLGCRFANAYACNDVTSFLAMWAEHRPNGSAVVHLNARADRPFRTRAFLRALADLEPPALVVLSGPVPTRWVREAGIDLSRVSRLQARNPDEAVAELCALGGPGATIWGAGNYAGIGQRIVHHLATRT